VLEVHRTGCLPVVNFAAGPGYALHAALMMQLGADGVFVGSGIFKSEDPERRARAIVKATTHYNDPKIIAEISRGLGDHARPQCRRHSQGRGSGKRVVSEPGSSDPPTTHPP
jgi:pyridoxal biosynthesis lyase PdxS